MCSSLDGSQSRDHQHGRHQAPRHIFAASGQTFLQPRIESERLPEFPGEPDVAEPPTAFQPETTRDDSDGLGREVLVKEAGLTLQTDERVGQMAHRDASLGVEFAELGDGLLPHLRSDAHRAHSRQPPVRRGLAVLGDGRVPQIHRVLQGPS